LAERERRGRRPATIRIGVIVRNGIAGSLATRTGIEEGGPVAPPVVEFYYKSDELGDPMTNDDHVRLLGLATPPELRWIRRTALRESGVLRPHLARRRLRIVDYKLEFGRAGRRLVLGDENSPDTCRLWDARTRERLS